jgi:hypothetical protein
MVEDVKHAGHAGFYATTPLTPRQPSPDTLRVQTPERPACSVIDYFALALSHFLIVVALIRLLGRDALDVDDTPQLDGPPPPAPGPRG